MLQRRHLAFLLVLAMAPMPAVAPARAADLSVELTGGEAVTALGAFRRWDADGNPLRPVNPDARIDAAEVDHRAVHAGGGRWVFRGLPPGSYDLVILAGDRLRLEGWTYAPILEFDPFFPPDAQAPEEARTAIVDHIAQSRHYENKVVPLYLGGDDAAVRVLVMLIRDLPTTYIAGAGTIRFELWQYTERYGGWVKEQRTRVLHRILLPVDQMRQWTWVWDPRLGGIEVGSRPLTHRYTVPAGPALRALPGLHPE